MQTKATQTIIKFEEEIMKVFKGYDLFKIIILKKYCGFRYKNIGTKFKVNIERLCEENGFNVVTVKRTWLQKLRKEGWNIESIGRTGNFEFEYGVETNKPAPKVKAAAKPVKVKEVVKPVEIVEPVEVKEEIVKDENSNCSILESSKYKVITDKIIELKGKEYSCQEEYDGDIKIVEDLICKSALSGSIQHSLMKLIDGKTASVVYTLLCNVPNKVEIKNPKGMWKTIITKMGYPVSFVWDLK